MDLFGGRVNTKESVWESDSDREYDDEYKDDPEYQQHDIAPERMKKEFTDNVLKIKHSIYDHVITSPPVGTSNAQNINLLQTYVAKMNLIHELSKNAQKGTAIPDVNEYPKELSDVPSDTKESIKSLLEWTMNFFRTNQPSDTIPYADFFRIHFHVYPFIQENSFVKEE